MADVPALFPNSLPGFKQKLPSLKYACCFGYFFPQPLICQLYTEMCGLFWAPFLRLCSCLRWWKNMQFPVVWPQGFKTQSQVQRIIVCWSSQQKVTPMLRIEAQAIDQNFMVVGLWNIADAEPKYLEFFSPLHRHPPSTRVSGPECFSLSGKTIGRADIGSFHQPKS